MEARVRVPGLTVRVSAGLLVDLPVRVRIARVALWAGLAWGVLFGDVAGRFAARAGYDEETGLTAAARPGREVSDVRGRK
ncbi:hypothetical protein [Spongiactinospora rosea]|uniref:hypothetical protein n=1 Tax=Spongiactinospora rosea TaxID=2248750 RepID=UPI0011C03A24|nr:hypothetical protein [Spongiactinospora rosea]